VLVVVAADDGVGREERVGRRQVVVVDRDDVLRVGRPGEQVADVAAVVGVVRDEAGDAEPPQEVVLLVDARRAWSCRSAGVRRSGMTTRRADAAAPVRSITSA
jgi:hypothetical protein